MARPSGISVATVQDIAREAGLSASSVSAVLTGQHVKRRIAAGTVQRVWNAAKKLNYQPNVTARSLRAKSSSTKEIVLSVFTSYEAPLFLVSQAVRALEDGITRLNDPSTRYRVNIEVFHAGKLEELPGLVDGHRCNGAIVTNTISRDDDFLAATKFAFPVSMFALIITV